MAFWDSDETSRRKAFELLDQHPIYFDASNGNFQIYVDGKAFDKKICEAFAAMLDEGLIEKDGSSVGLLYHVEITRAGIAAKYANR